MQRLYAGHEVVIKDNDNGQEIPLSLVQFDNGQHKLFCLDDCNRYFDEVLYNNKETKLGVDLSDVQELCQKYNYELVGY
jgi:hypothetical protein